MKVLHDKDAFFQTWSICVKIRYHRLNPFQAKLFDFKSNQFNVSVRYSLSSGLLTHTTFTWLANLMSVSDKPFFEWIKRAAACLTHSYYFYLIGHFRSFLIAF